MSQEVPPTEKFLNFKQQHLFENIRKVVNTELDEMDEVSIEERLKLEIDKALEVDDQIEDECFMLFNDSSKWFYTKMSQIAIPYCHITAMNLNFVALTLHDRSKLKYIRRMTSKTPRLVFPSGNVYLAKSMMNEANKLKKQKEPDSNPKTMSIESRYHKICESEEPFKDLDIQLLQENPLTLLKCAIEIFEKRWDQNVIEIGHRELSNKKRLKLLKDYILWKKLHSIGFFEKEGRT